MPAYDPKRTRALQTHALIVRLLPVYFGPSGDTNDHCGNCNTQCFDRRCRGERVVRIFGARVLIISPILFGLARDRRTRSAGFDARP
jgi:hypothetical protein